MKGQPRSRNCWAFPKASARLQWCRSATSTAKRAVRCRRIRTAAENQWSNSLTESGSRSGSRSNRPRSGNALVSALSERMRAAGSARSSSSRSIRRATLVISSASALRPRGPGLPDGVVPSKQRTECFIVTRGASELDTPVTELLRVSARLTEPVRTLAATGRATAASISGNRQVSVLRHLRWKHADCQHRCTLQCAAGRSVARARHHQASHGSAQVWVTRLARIGG